MKRETTTVKKATTTRIVSDTARTMSMRILEEKPRFAPTFFQVIKDTPFPMREIRTSPAIKLRMEIIKPLHEAWAVSEEM